MSADASSYAGRPPQGNLRKRRYRDDDEFDRRPQRRRYEEPLFVTVRRELIFIAESAVKSPDDDIRRASKLIIDNSDDEDVKRIFLDVSLQLTVQQPLKIPFLAAIIIGVNAQRPELVAQLLTRSGTTVESYMKSGEWREVKLVLRLLACLQCLFNSDGIFTVLDELFSRAVTLQTTSSEDSLGLELVKTILFTIAYVMTDATPELASRANTLLENTDIIASTPHSLETLVNPYPTDDDTNSIRLSVIGLLQTQLQDEAQLSWGLTCLPRPLKMAFPQEASMKGDAANGDDQEANQADKIPKHAFPKIAVPDPVINGARAIYPDIYLSIYLNQAIDTVPPLSSIASSLIRDGCADTINLLDCNRNIAAKTLIDVDRYFSPGTFIKRGVPFDKVFEVAGEQGSTWKPEDVVIDVIFSQLFQLPTPEHKHVYYHSVLTEACKIAPSAVAPSLGRAIRFLYRNISQMDLSLSHRFLDWFSHHLSNFGFTWKWGEWIEDLNLPDVHPRKAFIMGTIEKEIRLSFAGRIKGTLPEPYQYVFTEKKMKDIPDFKYDKETTPYAKEGVELKEAIRQRAPDEVIQPILDSIHKQAEEHQVDDPLVRSTDAFVTSVCHVGAKSLSHLLSCVERNKNRLFSIGPASEAARQQIITSVLEYWTEKPGVGINIVDKLLNYGILTPSSIISWALVDKFDGGYVLAELHVFEMVSGTMNKVTNRLRQIIAARTQPGLYEPQLSLIDDALSKEKTDMDGMFRLIDDSLVVITTATEDGMIERSDDDRLIPKDELIRDWGKRWMRTFRRMATVEQAFYNDAMVAASPRGTERPPEEVAAPPAPMDENVESAENTADASNAEPAGNAEVSGDAEMTDKAEAPGNGPDPSADAQ